MRYHPIIVLIRITAMPEMFPFHSGVDFIKFFYLFPPNISSLSKSFYYLVPSSFSFIKLLYDKFVKESIFFFRTFFINIWMNRNISNSIIYFFNRRFYFMSFYMSFFQSQIPIHRNF